MGLKINQFDYPKSIYNTKDCIYAVSNDTDIILDYFAGSGTTGQATLSLNRKEGSERKYTLVEMGEYFDTVLKPRITKAAYSENWKNGHPVPAKNAPFNNIHNSISHCFKYIRLESYEDTLNNLLLSNNPKRHQVVANNKNLRWDYLLNYFLDVETQGSQSLLNIHDFVDPTAYRMKIKQPGSDEVREQTVDLVETFNWLIGLWVEHLAAPQSFVGEFQRERDPDLPADDNTRLVCTHLRQDADGAYWFRTVQGYTLTAPGDNSSREDTLVIWRKLTDDPEADNAALQKYLETIGVSTRDKSYDVIYVNGSHTLPNPLVKGGKTHVCLLEEAFHQAMWSET